MQDMDYNTFHVPTCMDNPCIRLINYHITVIGREALLMNTEIMRFHRISRGMIKKARKQIKYLNIYEIVNFLSKSDSEFAISKHIRIKNKAEIITHYKEQLGKRLEYSMHIEEYIIAIAGIPTDFIRQYN